MTEIDYEKKEHQHEHHCGASPLFGFYVFLALVAIIAAAVTLFF